MRIARAVLSAESPRRAAAGCRRIVACVFFVCWSVVCVCLHVFVLAFLHFASLILCSDDSIAKARRASRRGPCDVREGGANSIAPGIVESARVRRCYLRRARTISVPAPGLVCRR